MTPPAPCPNPEPHHETPAEERLNCITHGIGAVLSVVAGVALVTLATRKGGPIHVATAAVFGASLVLLYLASTCFHACPRHRSRAKHWLKALDHVAIYVLIAGSYTPFLLVNIRGGWGWGLFAVLWGLAAVGTVFKLCFTRLLMVRWVDIASSLIYVAMGWIGIVALGPFLQALPGGALAWILAGGLAYTAGVVFYLWDSLPFNHAVWHLFVMTGSACHVLAVLLYVIPG